MSSSEEIQADFEQDIRNKEKLVGTHSLYDNFEGFQIENFPDTVSATNRELLYRIFANDTEWQNEYVKFSDEDKRRFSEIVCEIADEDNEQCLILDTQIGIEP